MLQADLGNFGMACASDMNGAEGTGVAAEDESRSG